MRIVILGLIRVVIVVVIRILVIVVIMRIVVLIIVMMVIIIVVIVVIVVVVMILIVVIILVVIIVVITIVVIIIIVVIIVVIIMHVPRSIATLAIPRASLDKEVVIEISLGDLALTEHQKAMLAPPEHRIREIVFPKSLQDRVSAKRRSKRKNRWSQKFRGLFSGKSAQKWARRLASEGGREALNSEATGIAKVKQVAKSMGASLMRKVAEKIKADKRTRKEAKKTEKAKKPKNQEIEPCPDSPWLTQTVRVVGECLFEGRRGEVRAVTKYVGSEPPEYRLQVNDKDSKGLTSFLVDSSEVVTENPDWVQAKPFKLDYRGLNKRRREEFAFQLAITNTESVVENETLELGTVHALLAEIQTRVGVAENTLLVPPATSVVFARDGIEGWTEEEAKWIQAVDTSEHLYIVVHSEGPSHYTLVEVHKSPEGNRIEFRDSLPDPPAGPRAAVEKILKNLHIVDEDFECPPRSNKLFQRDGWSCGIWACRWVERSLRELRGEGRSLPPSIKDCWVRGNEFIDKIKAAAPKPKAEPKPKAKPEPKPRKIVEPTYDTLEKALEAAKKCSKCLPTKAGTKGCRACMGEWFEEIRQKRFPSLE